MSVLAVNRKARFDYEILETIEAGLVLSGWEAKSIRNKGARLTGSHAIVRGGELYLVGAGIEPYQAGNMPPGAEAGRTIKLLASKKEIAYLAARGNETRLALIPLKLYLKNGMIKVGIGIARGKRTYDKREAIKKRDEERRLRRAL